MINSLQDKPQDIRFTKNSFASKLIRSSPEYQAKIKEIVRKKVSTCAVGKFSGKEPIRFEKGELFATIHDADVVYSGIKKAAGSWQMTVIVKDRWDFHFQHYLKESFTEIVKEMVDAQANLPGLMLRNGLFVHNMGWLQPIYNRRDRILGIVANNLAAASQITGAVQNYNWEAENQEEGKLG